MAEVDPDDDGIGRYVVYHYRHDAERRERRHVVVAAYDDEAEFERRLNELAAALRSRPDADPREHVSGTFLEPGYRRRQQHGRQVARAIAHGIVPSDENLADLPPNVAVLRFTDPLADQEVTSPGRPEATPDERS